MFFAQLFSRSLIQQEATGLALRDRPPGFSNPRVFGKTTFRRAPQVDRRVIHLFLYAATLSVPQENQALEIV